MLHKRIIWAGLAAGVLCHIMQGIASYLYFDRFYLENTDLVRDLGYMVALYYLILNLIIGVAIAYLAASLKNVWKGADSIVGMKAGFIIWAASSPVFVAKRQIILKLSNWLLLEILADLIIYIVIGAVAGFLTGSGIIDKKEDS
jgi:hypothetical protein